MTTTTDPARLLKESYNAKPTPALLTVPPGHFLVVEGQGEPAGEAFTLAVEALYATSYTLKFRLKAQGLEFKVGALEGLWPEGGSLPRTEWRWKLMIRQPDFVTAAFAAEAVEQVLRKKQSETARRVRLEWFDEGAAAQALHVGPYDAERATIEKLLAFVAAQGYRPAGVHHEIYLSDPKRTKPERLKTILRYPVERS